MPMTVVATRNVSSRIRGFLASSMLELTPGVYCSPRMNAGVRERVWTTLQEWFAVEQGASITMVWADPAAPGGQRVEILGAPRVDLVELDGLVVTRKPLR